MRGVIPDGLYGIRLDARQAAQAATTLSEGLPGREALLSQMTWWLERAALGDQEPDAKAELVVRLQRMRGPVQPPPGRSAVPALLDLLEDPRPSRRSAPDRDLCVAEAAWATLTGVLGGDPRALAGHPTDRPWTPEERHAAAEAVRRWWREGRSGGPPLTLAAVARPLADTRDADSRTEILDRLAAQWSDAVLGEAGSDDLARVLAAARNHQGLLTALAGWKPTGTNAVLTACHRLRWAADAEPIAAQLAIHLQAADLPAISHLAAAMSRSDAPAALAALDQVVSREPLDVPALVTISAIVGQTMRTADDLETTLMMLDEDIRRAANPPRLARILRLISDLRPLPPVNAARDGNESTLRSGAWSATIQASGQPAKDLRVADLAMGAFNLSGLQRALPRLDLALPIAERDRILADIRTALIPPVRKPKKKS